jgi:hypothetical protein
VGSKEPGCAHRGRSNGRECADFGGFSRVENADPETKTVSTVLPHCDAGGAQAKPLKRLGMIRSTVTGLNPGVNETVQKTELRPEEKKGKFFSRNSLGDVGHSLQEIRFTGHLPWHFEREPLSAALSD